MDPRTARFTDVDAIGRALARRRGVRSHDLVATGRRL